jgi:hypothetical protein
MLANQNRVHNLHYKQPSTNSHFFLISFGIILNEQFITLTQNYFFFLFVNGLNT